jgi:hypothetical protein
MTMMGSSGRRTQFYVDIAYGAVMATGFGYLLLAGMNATVVAFLGGAVFGYVLRVWENVQVYEQVLAEEAEEAVAAEVQEQIPAQAQEAVAAEAEEQVAAEVEERVPTEVERDAEPDGASE